MAKDDDVVPGLVLEPDLAAKLDNLDDNLQPINKDLVEDDKSKKPDAEEESEEDDSEKSEEESGEEGEESEQSEESTEEADSESEKAEESEDDDGYTIDEGEEEEPDEELSKPSEEKANAQLTPEQKYIIDGLTPITVRGTIGTETEVKEYKVYSPEYLPQGFKFVDDRDLAAANSAFSALENRALQLQTDYRNQETQKATTEFKKREDLADRQDIANLQRDGQIPKFRADPNSADFEKDPGVILVQEVIDFKEAQNSKYMTEYNAGRPYKHIGFDEAFRMYQRQNPTKSNPDQTKEDKERVAVAKRTSKANGSPAKDSRSKARVHSGMSTMDLENLIESKTADW